MKHSAPHYPAPWTAGPAYNNDGGWIGITANDPKTDQPHEAFAEVAIAMEGTAFDDPVNNPLRANAQVFLAAPNLLEACKAQHEAIDRLMAMLIAARTGFLPSKSGQIWEALNQGNDAIVLAEEDTLP